MRATLPFVLLGVALGAGAAGAAGDMDLPAFKVERWVNSGPLTADTLRGKVVLVDFWEYTCVNWIRTAPYVKAWHRDYADRGLVVVGVHAPEFEFGKQAQNIDRGVRDHGLTYPIGACWSQPTRGSRCPRSAPRRPRSRRRVSPRTPASRV